MQSRRPRSEARVVVKMSLMAARKLGMSKDRLSFNKATNFILASSLRSGMPYLSAMAWTRVCVSSGA